MIDRHTRNDIKKGINNPSLALKYIYNQMIIPGINARVVKPINEFNFRRKYGEGIDVLSEDWDNLIILDCLRYDIFEKMNTLEGDMECVLSKASRSLDFVKRNFEGRDATDCVYVTANGWNEKLESDPFFTTAKTYDEFDDRLDFYDPEQVFDLSVKTFEKFEKKRYIIHFMQPHAPYLGDYADELRSRVSDEYNIGFNQINQLRGREIDDPKISNLQEAAELGYINLSDLKKAYVENIEIVLPYVEQLHSEMGGKTVVTADHGELLGEKKSPLSRDSIGHFGELACHELRQVPWLVLEDDTRRVTQHDPAIGSETVSDEKVENTLEALGYLN